MKPVQALIGDGDLPGEPASPQEVIGGLGQAEAVDDAPAGAGPEVLEKPDQPTAIRVCPLRHSANTWAIISPETTRLSCK